MDKALVIILTQLLNLSGLILELYLVCYFPAFAWGEWGCFWHSYRKLNTFIKVVTSELIVMVTSELIVIYKEVEIFLVL